MKNPFLKWDVTIEDVNDETATPQDFPSNAPFSAFDPTPDITLRITYGDESAVELLHASELTLSPPLLDKFTATLNTSTQLEAIVRALATQAPVQQTGWDDTFDACALCDASNAYEMGKPTGELEGVRFADHAEDCPWRQAVEWTQQQ